MSYNLGNLSKEDMDKVNVEIAASGVAYKERLNIPVVAQQVEAQQPAEMRAYFLERLAHYRKVSIDFPKGTAPVYQQMADANGKK
ncbi:DNA polymerase III subunit theta [Sodalis ligni]|uniref:DNA polymerase-3 subunit theta n=1 Tax=Sodalis ligni TaxID=2697027 RepID=A0A4V2Q3I8_9GAMM|nr:DNA polymerase III subunit theta [Sodalis ligni]TCL06888.1 DNA polymerase-3 subunit theta [Sodalis ligni]